MSKLKSLKQWTPSYPIPNRDNIFSSQAKAKNEKGFSPSYENSAPANMYLLLSEEYRRMWFKERSFYEKEVYTKKEMMKEESKIKRRFVQKDFHAAAPKDETTTRQLEPRKVPKAAVKAGTKPKVTKKPPGKKEVMFDETVEAKSKKASPGNDKFDTLKKQEEGLPTKECGCKTK